MSLEKNNPFLSPLIEIQDPVLRDKAVRLWIKRDDLLKEDEDLAYCGNKWRKLKYNLLQAKAEGYNNTLLTFGGAYSNHIAAVASAGRLQKLKTIGVIRGERIEPLNPTLEFAEHSGMHLEFVSRTVYRTKETPPFLSQLSDQFGDFFLLPEGGSNLLALRGAAELGDEIIRQSGVHSPDYVCVSCGTGGTLAGLIMGSHPNSAMIGFSVLKGDFMAGEVSQLLESAEYSGLHKWQVNNQYHFGGYARFNEELLDFIHWFGENKGIPLDPIYTGKMMYGVWDLIKNGKFPPGSKVVAIHTGGLQGIAGFNERFGTEIKIKW